jgi:preprotein translocase subunit YajC
MFNDKLTKNIAEAAAKIMQEDLKGMQKKLDINEAVKPSYQHYKREVLPLYHKHGLSPEFAKAVDDHVKKYGDQQVYNHHGDAGGGMPHWFDSDKQKVKSLKPHKGYDVNEGIEDRLEAARAKAKAAGKPVNPPAKPAATNIRKVSGTAYGGSAQKDEPESDDDNKSVDTPKRGRGRPKGSTNVRRYDTKVYSDEPEAPKRGRGRPKGSKNKVKLQGESFSEIMEDLKTGGLKALYDHVILEEIIEEEPDNEQFTKELEKQKRKEAGTAKDDEKAKVAKASVQAVKNEEVENEEVELTEEEKSELKVGDKVHAGYRYKGGAGYKGIVHKVEPDHVLINVGKDRFGEKIVKASHKVVTKEEVEAIEERELTPAETEKKEEIVKSMKKNMAGFKERYGKRAKEVMYATATKSAKGE